jgi:hypothetical protein
MTSTLTRAQRRVQEALAELRGARTIAERNPSADNLKTVIACAEALDVAIEASQRNN